MNILKTTKALGSNIIGGVKTSIGGGLLAALGVYFIMNNTLESQLYSIGLIAAAWTATTWSTTAGWAGGRNKGLHELGLVNLVGNHGHAAALDHG